MNAGRRAASTSCVEHGHARTARSRSLHRGRLREGARRSRGATCRTRYGAAGRRAACATCQMSFSSAACQRLERQLDRLVVAEAALERADVEHRRREGRVVLEHVRMPHPSTVCCVSASWPWRSTCSAGRPPSPAAAAARRSRGRRIERRCAFGDTAYNHRPSARVPACRPSVELGGRERGAERSSRARRRHLAAASSRWPRARRDRADGVVAGHLRPARPESHVRAATKSSIVSGSRPRSVRRVSSVRSSLDAPPS